MAFRNLCGRFLNQTHQFRVNEELCNICMLPLDMCKSHCGALNIMWFNLCMHYLSFVTNYQILVKFCVCVCMLLEVHISVLFSITAEIFCINMELAYHSLSKRLELLVVNLHMGDCVTIANFDYIFIYSIYFILCFNF